MNVKKKKTSLQKKKKLLFNFLTQLLNINYALLYTKHPWLNTSWLYSMFCFLPLKDLFFKTFYSSYYHSADNSETNH